MFSIMQPSNVELVDYGRLVRDGELKVKCEGDSTQKTRYVRTLHCCSQQYKTRRFTLKSNSIKS